MKERSTRSTHLMFAQFQRGIPAHASNGLCARQEKIQHDVLSRARRLVVQRAARTTPQSHFDAINLDQLGIGVRFVLFAGQIETARRNVDVSVALQHAEQSLERRALGEHKVVVEQCKVLGFDQIKKCVASSRQTNIVRQLCMNF